MGVELQKKRTKKKRLIMAVGKNKRMSKGSKKGGKKKVVDPFTKKDWYDIKAPNMFKVRQVGKTLVTRTIGNKIAADGLKGRVFDCNQADLQEDGTGYRKFKLICEDVQGKNCVLNFHGMELTRDKVCSMVKKWQTMIKCQVDVKTTDNYHLRSIPAGQADPKEDDRACCQSGVQRRHQRAYCQAPPRQHRCRDRQSRPANLPDPGLLREQDQGREEAQG